jgi:arsenate reductase (thioredoxin)
MTDNRKRVLFVCIGNSCRSQMAEGFARTYGADVMIPASAGLAPAMGIAPDTRRAMLERNIDVRDHFPKTIRQLGRARFDLAINMSGEELPPDAAESILEWEIPDPIRLSYERHCEVRDEIERKVMSLILDLRREQSAPALRNRS